MPSCRRLSGARGIGKSGVTNQYSTYQKWDYDQFKGFGIGGADCAFDMLALSQDSVPV